MSESHTEMYYIGCNKKFGRVLMDQDPEPQIITGILNKALAEYIVTACNSYPKLKSDREELLVSIQATVRQNQQLKEDRAELVKWVSNNLNNQMSGFNYSGEALLKKLGE